MGNASTNLPAFPAETVEQGLKLVTGTFTSMADVAAKVAEPGSPWLRESLLAIETSLELAEALFAEIRRAKHVIRCKLEGKP
jgi:hypothetical protein